MKYPKDVVDKFTGQLKSYGLFLLFGIKYPCWQGKLDNSNKFNKVVLALESCTTLEQVDVLDKWELLLYKYGYITTAQTVDYIQYSNYTKSELREGR